MPARRWSSSSTSPRGGTRFASAAWRRAARARCPRARSSRSSTTTCRSSSIRCWASCRPVASRCGSCSTRSSRASATRPDACRPSAVPATATGATGTRKATSPSTCAPCRRPKPASWRRRSPTSWRRCASWSPIGERCCSASKRGANNWSWHSPASQARCWARRPHFCNGSSGPTSPSSARAPSRSRATPTPATSRRWTAAASAFCAIRMCRCCAAAASWWR